MSLRSSSTSSSEIGVMIRRSVLLLAWIIASLIGIDLAINIVFRYPADPMNIAPSKFQLYFEYGRSSEAKLDRMMGTGRNNSAPISLAGWYDPLEVQDNPKRQNVGIVTFYGMSHSVRLANALNRTSDRFVARSVAAPGATPNWAYGAFLRDRGGGKSKAVVLSLMSANLPMINTVSPFTWNVSFPMPYTADRFYLNNHTLSVVHPPYTSFDQYRAAFADPEKRTAALNFIAANDTMYDDFLVRKTVLDHSSLFRLIRRAYEQRSERQAIASVFGPNGFNTGSDQVKVANAIVREFAEQAREGGMIPVVFIVNSLGDSDTLYRALARTLDENRIPYLSSHTVVPPDDPRGYLPDSHFTDANDDRLALALTTVIERSSADEQKTKLLGSGHSGSK